MSAKFSRILLTKQCSSYTKSQNTRKRDLDQKMNNNFGNNTFTSRYNHRENENNFKLKRKPF